MSLAFEEVKLPARLAFGSTGGVERRTEVVTLGSGFERRATPWMHGRRRWLIGGAIRKLEDAAVLVAFFEARRGRLTGFRFEDFADAGSAAPGRPITPLDQALGLGDGARTVFALAKSYGDGAGAYSRPITKPVAGSVRIAIAGVETTAFVADTTTGLLTLFSPPPAGSVVTAGFRFDTPVRFDADRIDVTLEGFDAGRVVAVPLIEVRV